MPRRCFNKRNGFFNFVSGPGKLNRNHKTEMRQQEQQKGNKTSLRSESMRGFLFWYPVFYQHKRRRGRKEKIMESRSTSWLTSSFPLIRLSSESCLPLLVIPFIEFLFESRTFSSSMSSSGREGNTHQLLILHSSDWSSRFRVSLDHVLHVFDETGTIAENTVMFFIVENLILNLVGHLLLSVLFLWFHL